MKRYVNSATASVALGCAIGLVVSSLFLDTEPAFLGWVFGVGMGLMGGAFVAALVSGSALVGGSAPGGRRKGRSAAPWLDPTDEDSGNGTR